MLILRSLIEELKNNLVLDASNMTATKSNTAKKIKKKSSKQVAPVKGEL